MIEARTLCNMQIVGSRHETNDNDNDDDEEKEVLREIDLHSVRHLFVLISMVYSLALILSIFEQILHKLTHRLFTDNRVTESRTIIVNSW